MFFRCSVFKLYYECLCVLLLFQDLIFSEFDIVFGLFYECEYFEYEVFFDEGEEGYVIYIIMFGYVLICCNSDFKKQFIVDFGFGSFFGELVLFINVLCVIQVRVGSNCKILVFFCDDFNNLMYIYVVIVFKIGINFVCYVGVCLCELVVGWCVEQLL